MLKMFEKVKKVLNYKLISNKHLIISIVIFVPLFIIIYSGYLLSKNTVKMDIPEITDKQKGSYIDIYIPYYLYEDRGGSLSSPPDSSIMVSRNTLTLLPDNKVLYLVADRAIIFDFDKKIAYTNRYLSFLGYPINSPKFDYIDDITPVLLPDGKVLIFGFLGSEIFDSKLNKFYPIANMLHKRYHRMATLLPNKKVLIIGGCDPSNTENKFSEAELYDSQLNKYTALSNMHAKRFGHTATLLKDGRVLIVGGNNKDQPYAELYDYKTGKFYPLANNGKTRYDHTATLLPDGRVLIIGGYDIFGKDYSDIEIFDPEINKFKEIGRLIYPNWEHSTILLKSQKVFVTGGKKCNKLRIDACNAQLYDLNTNKSSLVSGSSFSLASAIMLKDGRVLLLSNYYLHDNNKIKLYIP